jgi:hypothetical protein
MTDQKLKAYGINLPDAQGVLDTPEELKEFHKRLEAHCKEAFEEFDRARRKAWELSFSRFFG